MLGVSTAVLRGSLIRDERDANDEVQRTTNVASAIVGLSITSAQQQLAALGAGQVFERQDLDGISNVITRFNPVAKGFSGSVGWIDTNGILQVSSEGGTGVVHHNLLDRKYVIDSLAGDFSVSDVLIGRLDERPLIVISAPTYGPDGRVNGVLAGASQLDRPSNKGPDLFGSASIDILDSNGMIISTARKDLDAGSSITGTSLWQQIQKGGNSEGLLNGSTGLEGEEDQLVGYATVQPTGWRVLAQLSRNEAYAAPARHFRVALGSISIVVILASIGGAILARQINRSHRQLVESEQLLSGTLAELTVGIVVVDTSSDQILQRNPRLEEIFSHQPITNADDLFRLFRARHSDNRLYEKYEWPMFRAIRGETVAGVEVFVPFNKTYTGVFRISAAPVHDEDGVIRRAIGVFEDVTERFWSAVRERRVTEVVAQMASARSSQEICRIATDQVIDAFGARAGAVFLVDNEKPSQLRGRSSCGYAVDFEELQPVVALQQMVPTNSLWLYNLESVSDLRTNVPELFDDQDDSWIASPLLSGGRKIGAIWLAFRDGPVRDVNVHSRIQAFAAQLGQALDSTAQSELEHDFVLTLQRSVLEHIPESICGLSLNARYLPASDRLNLGGDWYDVIRIGESKVAFVIGDVVGHGTQAAATMDQLRSAVRALAPIVGPAALLDQLDHFAADPAVPGAFGASVAIIFVDTAAHTATIALAGHPPPLMRAPSGVVTWLKHPHGPLLGTSKSNHQEVTVPAPAHTSFLLYTDGLVERRNSDFDSRLDLLENTFKASSGLPADVCDAVLRNLLTDNVSDDVAVLCFRTEENTAI